MAQFLYFVCGVDRDPADALRLRGLLDRFGAWGGSNGELGRHARTSIAAGPDNRGGLLIAADSVGLRYHADSQTWRGPLGSEAAEYWIGMETQARPGPGDLRRQRCVGGSEVELLDGRRWLIPAARRAPMGIRMAPDGAVSLEPLEIGRVLWGLTEELIGMLEREEDIPWEFELRLAAEALAVNYRIGRDPVGELAMLELISTDNIIEINRAVLDLDAFGDEAEKKTPDV
jgi:hypothetical protein